MLLSLYSLVMMGSLKGVQIQALRELYNVQSNKLTIKFKFSEAGLYLKSDLL